MEVVPIKIADAPRPRVCAVRSTRALSITAHVVVVLETDYLTTKVFD